MIRLFTITIFLAAALLFGVQPMVAKSLLPGFGGGSSVWTTCMLFFQTLLIAGYLYAHLLLKFVPKRGQMIVHGVVILAALGVGWLYQVPNPPAGGSAFPVPWLIGQLFLVAGLPYFAVSSAGPLIQGWFARTGHERGGDPYFLYSASNAGSFVGLLAYPLVLEPTLGLGDQRILWLVGFALFGVLAAACVRNIRNQRTPDDAKTTGPEQAAPIGWKRRLWWMYLGFVPSSMLLAVTMHITTDVASFPLLWVVPLALYLLTMIVAFSRFGPRIVRLGVRPMIVCVIGAWVLLFAAATADRSAPIAANIGLQLALLAAVGAYAHSRLAQDRPHASRLTEFYLVMSVGGALGGLFNGIVAPLVFSDVFEYHITLVAALLVIPGVTRSAEVPAVRFWFKRLRLGLVSFVLVAAYFVYAPMIGEPMVALAAGAIVPGVLMYVAWRDRVACAGVLSFPLLALGVHDLFDPNLVHKERTFYGVHIVSDRAMTPDRGEEVVIRRLLHGTTLHGLQMFVDDRFLISPMGYYHVNGPLGAVMRGVDEVYPDGARVCLIGMGTGASASYARANDHYEYYEIDPAVVRIARDTGYFSYLASARTEIGVKVGDGRLLLEESAANNEEPFDLILVDAFSSDSIPTHLLTVEAIRLYFDRLAPGGVVAMHVSNRYLNLTGLLYSIANEVGAVPMIYQDDVTLDFSMRTGRFSSVWVTLTKDPDAALRLERAGFSRYRSNMDTKVWTDQYSNLLSVFITE